MHGDSVCQELQTLLAKIEQGKGTANDIEEVRKIVNQWDEYASWEDER